MSLPAARRLKAGGPRVLRQRSGTTPWPCLATQGTRVTQNPHLSLLTCRQAQHTQPGHLTGWHHDPKEGRKGQARGLPMYSHTRPWKAQRNKGKEENQATPRD